MTLVVATFYKFVQLLDIAADREALLAVCQAQAVRGTILLATEGINGTLAGSRAAIDAVLAYLRADERLADLTVRESQTEQMPFDRMKVRLKREIVTLGQETVDPTQQVGHYVDPQDWNNLISDPDVILIDTRNQYEVAIGTFQGAHSPETESFRQFPAFVQQQLDPQVHKKVAMFCTGGIRCEKASSYLLAQGFESVYHLKGGILNYLETVPATDSLWRGECFVFDQRVALQHGLADGSYAMCPDCGYPIAKADRASEYPCPNCGHV